MGTYTAFDLDPLFECHFFSSLDYYFARSMARAFEETNAIVLASCALVSKQLLEGHICLDIKEMSTTDNGRVKYPGFNTWITALKTSSMVSKTAQTPLVLDAGYKLYFSKYYDFQDRLIQNISQRVCSGALEIDKTTIDELLEVFFKQTNTFAKPQENAIRNSLINHFTIISGGPGTGKTFVASIIKKVFLLYAKKHGLREPKIICVAPTGKAASKMEQGSTLHAILKPLKKRPGFYYNKNNPLQTDMVIIDEGSMIDIPLLTRFLEAVPMTAKVIILGDKHQLSSIQAGSVFSDLCRVKGLASNIFFLEYNFRSKGKTGIEKLSKAINENNENRLEDLLISGRYPDLVFERLSENTPVASIINKYCIQGYRPFVMADSVEAALRLVDDFKILCAHNSGEYGTLQINHVCEKILRSDNIFDIQTDSYKKIIMVKTNDYKKGLFNGDTGIVFDKKEGPSAFFMTLDNTIKQYRVSDLPGFDTAFAITIHKSQGSEFNTVLIIVPDTLSPVITRQLLYTGVTRAKKKIIIAGNIEIIKKAMNLSIKRNSGVSTGLEKLIQKGNTA